jgi:hypothetical protein
VVDQEILNFVHSIDNSDDLLVVSTERMSFELLIKPMASEGEGDVFSVTVTSSSVNAILVRGTSLARGLSCPLLATLLVLL